MISGRSASFFYLAFRVAQLVKLVGEGGVVAVHAGVFGLLHDVNRVRLDIKADVLVHIDEICGLYHPLDAADIDDYLIVYAEECDGGHDALEHSLFLGNNVHVLGADNDVNVLALFKAGVHAIKGVTGELTL